MTATINNPETGAQLPGYEKKIERQSIDLYAKASGDYNPIHTDEEFAAKSQFGGIIAHGMLVLSYLTQMLTAAFGDKWFDGGKLDIRFKTPARAGDILLFGGIIREVKNTGGEGLVVCEVFCRNQHGEPVILGEAAIKL
ncbi:MaoC family dehydratase [Chloroflexota bacterium]